MLNLIDLVKAKLESRKRAQALEALNAQGAARLAAGRVLDRATVEDLEKLASELAAPPVAPPTARRKPVSDRQWLLNHPWGQTVATPAPAPAVNVSQDVTLRSPLPASPPADSVADAAVARMVAHINGTARRHTPAVPLSEADLAANRIAALATGRQPLSTDREVELLASTPQGRDVLRERAEQAAKRGNLELATKLRRAAVGCQPLSEERRRELLGHTDIGRQVLRDEGRRA